MIRNRRHGVAPVSPHDHALPNKARAAGALVHRLLLPDAVAAMLTTVHLRRAHSAAHAQHDWSAYLAARAVSSVSRNASR